jgi:hypothetical protein
MVNLLQKIGAPVAVALTPFIVNAGQVGAESIREPSPTFPENPPVLVVESNKPTASLPTSSPTNPTPKRDNTDIVNLSKASPFSLTRMPRDVSQIAQGEEQPSNNSPIVPPSRSDAAKAIADLQGEINQNNSQLVQGLQKHNESQNSRLQEILNRRKN